MSTFKELNISNPGTSTKYGGNDTDLINKLFNGITSGIPPVRIRSTNKFGFDDGILWIYNQALSKKTTIRGQSNAPSTDVDLRLPPITGNDVLPALNLEQAWLKKQQLNLGATFQEMDAPANPSASFHHLYLDSLTHHLTRKNSAGVVTDYDAIIGSGGTPAYFPDQTLKLKDPTSAFTLSLRNPIATANKKTGLWQPYKYLICRESSSPSTPLYCINQITREIEYEGITGACEDVFQYALDHSLRGSIYVAPGSYTMSGSFPGLNITQQETTLHMDPGALLFVPNGYAGYMMRLVAPISVCRIRGGRFSESGTPQKLWTGYDLYSTTPNGCSMNIIEHTYVRFTKNGIRLHTETNGWANINQFNGIMIDNSVVGILFEHTGTYTDAQSGCNTNSFNDLLIQSDAGFTHGIKDVNGRRNYFKNDYVIDFSGAQITMNITANARNTQLKGGTCSFLNFEDLEPAGSKAWITDEYQGDVANFRKTYLYEDGVATTAPASPPTGTTRAYTKTINSNNDGRFYKSRVNGAVVEIVI